MVWLILSILFLDLIIGCMLIKVIYTLEDIHRIVNNMDILDRLITGS